MSNPTEQGAAVGWVDIGYGFHTLNLGNGSRVELGLNHKGWGAVFALGAGISIQQCTYGDEIDEQQAKRLALADAIRLLAKHRDETDATITKLRAMRPQNERYIVEQNILGAYGVFDTSRHDWAVSNDWAAIERDKGDEHSAMIQAIRLNAKPDCELDGSEYGQNAESAGGAGCSP